MKYVKDIARQGDVLFLRVDTVPTDAKKIEGPEAMICAHSETGHHHRAKPTARLDCERFQDAAEPLVSYLRIQRKGAKLRGKADDALNAIDVVLIEHERTHDTHETLGLACEGDEAVYRVIRQRQAVPEGWAAVID